MGFAEKALAAKLQLVQQVSVSQLPIDQWRAASPQVSHSHILVAVEIQAHVRMTLNFGGIIWLPRLQAATVLGSINIATIKSCSAQQSNFFAPLRTAVVARPDRGLRKAYQYCTHCVLPSG